MANFGYARVSTADQNMALQLDALRDAGVTVSSATKACLARHRLDRVSTRALTTYAKVMSSSSGSSTASGATPSTSLPSSTT